MTAAEISAVVGKFSFKWNGCDLSFTYNADAQQLEVRVVAVNGRWHPDSGQYGCLTILQHVKVHQNRLTPRNIRSLLAGAAQKLWAHEFHETLRFDGRLVKDEHRPADHRRRRPA
jgi:hypothetical protein